MHDYAVWARTGCVAIGPENAIAHLLNNRFVTIEVEMWQVMLTRWLEPY